MTTVYLECTHDITLEGIELEKGKVYTAETTRHLGYAVYKLNGEEFSYNHYFTIKPDEEGVSYKGWFKLVESPEQKEMWTVTIMNYYYPTILHFDKERDARNWYEKYMEKKKARQVKQDDFENYESVYLSKIEKFDLATEDPWSDITWDADKDDFDYES